MSKSISTKINKAAFEEHINEIYKGKYRRLAEAIGMSYVQMWRILGGTAEPGGDFMYRFMKYCEDNKLEYAKFFNPIDAVKK